MLYDRTDDVMEEPVRFAILLQPHTPQLADRCSERGARMTAGYVSRPVEHRKQE